MRMYEVGRIQEIIDRKMSEYLTNQAVECEIHQSRLFALGKVEHTFFKLFTGGNSVIVCSESSIVRSDVYHFVHDFPILFQWSVAALFQYAFVETFTAKFKLFRGNVIAAVCLTT